MKVKCVLLLNTFGQEVERSSWMTLGHIYHVMSISISADGGRRYGIVASEEDGDWPDCVALRAECFEIVSTVVPSNWRCMVYPSGAIYISPSAWHEPGFSEAFSDHDPVTYPIFERERQLILREDP